MTSTDRIEANQKNAQLSTGPRSEDGKARTRLNALRHGFRSKSVLLPGENAEEYYELKARLSSEWKPETQNEEFLLEQLLSSQWRLRRITLMEEDLFVRSFEDAMPETSFEFDATLPGALTPALLDNKLALLIRYENSIRRAYYKALHELKAVQAERRKSEQAAQKTVQDAAVRQAVAEAERGNAAFNQKLIEMCEKIPAVHNDGHLYIQPRPRFGSDSVTEPHRK